MDSRYTLFLAGFLQVGLVGINTWQIAHSYWVGVVIVGFAISYTWTWNVKKVAFSSQADRFVYSLGATAGLVIGLLCVQYLYAR